MSYFLLARSGQNTVDLRIVPVIVIPGIMGSRLRLSDATAPTWDVGLHGVASRRAGVGSLAGARC